MTTLLRKIYEVSSCLSTATRTEMCNDLLRQLTRGKAERGNSLAKLFAEALEANKPFPQIERPFVPDAREGERERNPVFRVMKNASPLRVELSPDVKYEFTVVHKEIPHLRAMTQKEQTAKAWIDYVAHTPRRPVLGEIKWKTDHDPFYAFVQLLTYLSEIATPNQVERATRYKLFGNDMPTITAFDLHIFLADFNDRGKKGALIELTRQLAIAFKARLGRDYPAAALCLGDVLCISGHINESDCLSEIKCLWTA